MRHFFILLPIFLISFSFHATTPLLVGGWQPIENITDSHVQEVGNYAVSEHNRQSGDNLVFQEVVSGETQVIAGTNCRLNMRVTDVEGNAALYQAVVYEREWEGYRELTSFDRF